MKVKKFNEYYALNESFKSNLISSLVKSDLVEDSQLPVLNQISDDEILGIVDTAKEAKKLIHDNLGDMIETRYKSKRVWHRTGIDDWDDESVTDYDNPYKVNKTVDCFANWVLRLNDGRFLVLKIEKSELNNRLYKITSLRKTNKTNTDSSIRKKFLQRKQFVEKNKDSLKEYWKFKKFLEENNILDEFFNTAYSELTKWENEFMDSNDFADTVLDSDGYTACDVVEFKINGFTFCIDFDAYFDGNISCWDDRDYDGDSGCAVEDGHMVIDNACVSVMDDLDNELFSFSYHTDFDKKYKIEME